MRMLEAERNAQAGGSGNGGGARGGGRQRARTVLEDHPELAEHLASIPDEIMIHEMDDLDLDDDY